MAIDLDAMYKSFGILAEAKQNDLQAEEHYLTFIRGVKGDEKVKQLAAEFLQRFFDRFPAQQEHALDALMDLCEEPNTQIRSKAITSLFKIAKDNIDQIIRIADIITQFLQSEDEGERKNVEAYLLQLLNVDAKACIRGIFNHVGLNEEGVPPILQRRILQFLKNKSTEFPASMSQDEVAQFVLSKTSSVITDGSKEDSQLAVEFLHSLRYFNTVAGTQQILAILEKLVKLDANDSNDFSFDDGIQVEKLIRATEMSLAMFSPRTFPSNKFVSYYGQKVIPLIQPKSENAKHLEVLRLFAQITTNIGADLADSDAVMMNVLDKTQEVLPASTHEPVMAPTMADSAVGSTVTGPVSSSLTTPAVATPKLYLGYIECLLYALQQLGKRNETFLKDPGTPGAVPVAVAAGVDDPKTAKLRRFRHQLQYYSQLKQAYERKFSANKKKKLQQLSQPGTTPDAAAETKRQLEIVTRMITNVTQLIRDLFHTTPNFNSAPIKLSWKSIHAPSPIGGGDSTARKRITFDGAASATSTESKKSNTKSDDAGAAATNNGVKKRNVQNGSSFNNTGSSVKKNKISFDSTTTTTGGTGGKNQAQSAINSKNNEKRAALWRK